MPSQTRQAPNAMTNADLNPSKGSQVQHPKEQVGLPPDPSVQLRQVTAERQKTHNLMQVLEMKYGDVLQRRARDKQFDQEFEVLKKKILAQNEEIVELKDRLTKKPA